MALYGMADNEEAAVIDEEMIANSLVEEAEGDPTEISSRATFELAQMVREATVLRLSFKNILAIDNLQGFHSLTRLCLDNNIIDRIQNLSHLVHLEWLDLSFNCIRTLEGLDTLVNLRDLSLFNNQIVDIDDGLDKCTALQCLSLGNNKISALDTFQKLRQFRGLHMLNLEGNPVCREPEYRATALAYVETLKYFDYAMVDPAEVTQSREQYQDDIMDVEEKEALDADARNRDQAAAKIVKELEMANLLVAENLFDEMFDEDAEMAKLKHIPRIDELIEQFHNQFKSKADTFKTAGLELDADKKAEKGRFGKALQAVRASHARKSIGMIEAFNRKKKKVVMELKSRDVVDASDLDELQKDLAVLESHLMDLEMQQVEQFEDLVGEFETKYGEQRNACLELQQSFFREVEDYESQYTDQLTQVAADLLEQAAKEELPEDIPDELSNVLIDRDTCMNAISNSHEGHVGVLLKRDDEVRARENQAMQELLQQYRADQNDRNRKRIIEIQELIESNQKQMSDLVTTEILDEYDDQDGL